MIIVFAGREVGSRTIPGWLTFTYKGLVLAITPLTGFLCCVAAMMLDATGEIAHKQLSILRGPTP